MVRNILYRVRDADGELLYVGATTNPALRFHEHHERQPWWDEAREISLQHFGSPTELAEAEVTAIKNEKPRYNLLHSKPSVWSRKSRGPKGQGSVYQRPNGAWMGVLELPKVSGKRRRRYVYGPTRRDAQLKLAQLRAEIAP